MNEVVCWCFFLWLKSVMETSLGIGMTTGSALGMLLYQVSTTEL